MSRRQALWTVKGLADESSSLKTAPLLAAMGVKEHQVELPLMNLPQEVEEDYRTTSLSLRAHPISFFRESLDSLGAVKARDLAKMRDRRLVTVGGLVLVRQRPGTAKGICFVSLEDETGLTNLILHPQTYSACRAVLRHATVVLAEGLVQQDHGAVHVLVRRLVVWEGAS